MHPRSAREDGASVVEYALLIAGIAAIVVAAIVLFGGLVLDLFDDSCETVNSHVQDSSVSCQ